MASRWVTRAHTTWDPPASPKPPALLPGCPQLTSHLCEPGPLRCAPGEGSVHPWISTQGQELRRKPSDPAAASCDSRSSLSLHPMRNVSGTLGGLRNEGT